MIMFWLIFLTKFNFLIIDVLIYIIFGDFDFISILGIIRLKVIEVYWVVIDFKGFLGKIEKVKKSTHIW